MHLLQLFECSTFIASFFVWAVYILLQAYFKGNITIKQLLMKPKDQDPRDKKVGSFTATSVGTLVVMKNM